MKEKQFTLDVFLDGMENAARSVNVALNEKINEKSVDGEIIGTGRSDYTQDVTGYFLHTKGKEFVLYDVPGIEGNESAYEEIIRKAVNKAHLVFYVNSDNKKVEPKTAEKIKKYLRNDTDVYSLINVHLPPKAKRSVEIDRTYQDELHSAYKKDEKTIKPQTETTLKDVLGNNYKSGILLNGLESFSACAYDCDLGISTIIPDSEDKNLRKNQEKFLQEYENDIFKMKDDSNIKQVTDIIDNHTEHFKEFIIESNKKKLIARLNDSYEKISRLKNDSLKLGGKFIDAYKDIQKAVINSEGNFVSYIKRGYIENAVQDVINRELEGMFELIESYEGKLDGSDYESFFNRRKSDIEIGIQSNLKEGYENAVTEFKNSIEEAKNRFGKDIANLMKFVDVQFPSMQNINFEKIALEMNFTGKDFAGAAATIGSLAFSGFAVGSLFPGIGNIIGGIIGALSGIVFAIAGFLMGKEKRIARAKSKAKGIFDDLADELTSELEKNFQFDKYIENVKGVSSKIQSFCDAEIAKFELMEKNLNKLVKFISNKKSKLEELKYGTL